MGRNTQINKKKRDIISEQEFNLRSYGDDKPPTEDSPGDSEEISGEAFLIGLNYMPDEKNEYDRDEQEQPVFDRKSTAPSEVPSSELDDPEDRESHLPENAKVVSSETPAPWKDLDSPTSTH
ncbi:MAG: hypothetical protein AB7F59_01515 [Bdellovibrionales bacterium]